RVEENQFILGANGNVDLIRLRNNAPDDVFVKDITSGTIGLGLFGPKSRMLAQSICDDDLSNESLGYFKAKKTYLGQVPVTLWRLSYVGELGFEIYADADMGLKLWDTLFSAGKKFGLIPAGRGAFNSMRLEKGYRSYGAEMTSEHNPYEAGLSFAVRKTGGFIGSQAYEKIKPEQIQKKLCCLVIKNDFDVVMGKEPVLVNNKVVGYTTSAYYGHTIGAPLAYAWLPIEASAIGTKVEIQYFDKKVKAVVGNDPQFDPQMTRLKS
ncbi:MAG: hypothetical protein RLZZ37_146, partial [Actinomycetota bacterium]